MSAQVLSLLLHLWRGAVGGQNASKRKTTRRCWNEKTRRAGIGDRDGGDGGWRKKSSLSFRDTRRLETMEREPTSASLFLAHVSGKEQDPTDLQTPEDLLLRRQLCDCGENLTTRSMHVNESARRHL